MILFMPLINYWRKVQKAVLLKRRPLAIGTQALYVQDYFTDGSRSFWLSSPKQTTQVCRYGCALASAIASALALQYTLYDAVVIGKMAINQGYRQAYALSDAATTNVPYGPVHITHFPDTQDDLPYLTATASLPVMSAFPDCNTPVLGLYPVVDRAEWIPLLAKAGVTTVQLRVKDLSAQALENEVQTAIRLAQKRTIVVYLLTTTGS